MSWKDRLQKAAFRGVPFLFESADGELGRRIALHEYPLRDTPYAEDLGRRARKFVLEAYLLGAGYMEERDALIRALEEPGPGALVHPYRGTLQVVLLEGRGPRESTREGGMARFTLTFVEAGDNKYPTAAVATRQAVRDRSDAALIAVREEFEGAFSVAGRPEFVAADARSLSQKALDALAALSSRLPAKPAPAAAFAGELQRVSSALAGLIRQPAELALSTTGLLSGLAGLPADLSARPLAALDLYRDLVTFGESEDPVPGATPSRKQQAANRTALFALVRQGAVIEAARASTSMEFATRDDAVAVRDELTETIEVQAETAGDDAYRALCELRVAVVRDLTARGASLARLRAYTPPATMPALVIAHQVYGDASREAEIVERNRIRHPGFVAGGAALEVIHG